MSFGTLRISPVALESSLYGTSEGRGSQSRREDRVAFEEFSFLPVFALFYVTWRILDRFLGVDFLSLFRSALCGRLEWVNVVLTKFREEHDEVWGTSREK